MIPLTIKTQPTDETCGPTCLHAIYQYYGKKIDLKQVINTIEHSLSGGTLSPLLGKHALQNGFDATIFINNLSVFDPSWFKKTFASNEILLTKLKIQNKFKRSKGVAQVSEAFIEYLELGGTVRFQTIDVKMLKTYFDKGIPILAGVNSTYLYRTQRECFTEQGEAFFDDILGEPTGHFIVLCGYTDNKRQIVVADPFRENPFNQSNYYRVSSTRLINSILLGTVSYDANLLMITPTVDESKESNDNQDNEH